MLLPTGRKAKTNKGHLSDGLLDVASKRTSLFLHVAPGTMRFIAALCVCMVLCLQAHGFYLPGVAPQDHAKVRICHSRVGRFILLVVPASLTNHFIAGSDDSEPEDEQAQFI